VRIVWSLLILCGCAVLLLASSAAADTTPTCAEGPTTVGGTTYGTPCSDVIVASPRVSAVDAGAGNDTIVAAAASCPAGCHLGVGSQTFEGGEGDDVVFGERGNDILLGGPGDDQLFGGIGDDLLRGGAGEDRLAGGFGADSINGEEGNDYVRGDSTIDRIFDTGGDPGDVLSYSTGITPGFGGTVPVSGFPSSSGERGLRLRLTVTGENAENGVAPTGGGVDEVELGAFETIVGTPFSDYILGSSRGETIYGGGGADAIEGGGGGDTLVGGADGDLCQVGTTSECEAGVAPRDTSKVSVGFMTPPGATPYAQLYLVGSDGSDRVSASYSPTQVTFTLAAGTFDQSAADAGGCDVETTTKAVCALATPLDSLLLAGMGGNDAIEAANFPFTVSVFLTGGEGNDTLEGGNESEDVLIDGPGSGKDVLRGLGGDEALTHNGGADELFGGDGNDLFLSNSVCDDERIAGGAGRDNSSWARFGEGVEANLASGAAGRPGPGESPACGGEPLDSLSEIEDLEGSSFADVFYGDGGPNQLLGHPGADAFFAGGGEDSILANSGDADQVIDCGPDTDSALIDHPQYGDPQPIECESVAEADPNNFRTITQLPPPPLTEPPPQPSLDRRAPRTTLGSHPRSLIFTQGSWRRVAFRFASDEPGTRFRCRLDRKPYRGCTSPRAYRVKAGRHAFRVFAIDRSGNRDPSPALFKFRVVQR
jgi:Ca2+-binding RTX toxin-like protein